MHIGIKTLDVEKQIRAFIRTEEFAFKGFDKHKMGFTARLMKRFDPCNSTIPILYNSLQLNWTDLTYSDLIYLMWC
jgi:hypothetical protein